MLRVSVLTSLAVKGLSFRKACLRGICVSSEVLHAIANNQPVVALESTIISHGMPYPRNKQVVLDAENLIRSFGVVPAICAIINGVPKVGLTKEDLELLANPSDINRIGRSVLKASRRDIGYAMATKAIAATTVSGTMILAHAAGIQVFATGGIGGAHRGSEHTMDVSADLTELGKTPVIVVCAGVKSILDIPKTLEVLETQGVPVIGFNTEIFPAFFTNNSGIPSPMNVSDPKIIADMLLSQLKLGLNNGIVVGVPNPSPGDETIQDAIESALQEASILGIKGAKITPFVLAAVEKITKGSSLDANVALFMNNTKIASLIAIEIAKMKRPGTSTPSNTSSSSSSSFSSSSSSSTTSSSSSASSSSSSSSSSSGNGTNSSLSSATLSPFFSPSTISGSQPLPPPGHNHVKQPSVIVIGAAILDVIASSENTSSTKSKNNMTMGSSNPGNVLIGYGGVGRNIAESLARLKTSVALVSAVGDDAAGRGLLSHAINAGIDVSRVSVHQGLPHLSKSKREDHPSASTSHDSNKGHMVCTEARTDTPVSTASYCAIHDSGGQLVAAVADVRIIAALTPDSVLEHIQNNRKCQLVVADGNLPPTTFAALVEGTASFQIPLFFEPTSDHKCVLPIRTNTISKIQIIKPNFSELRAMVAEGLATGYIVDNVKGVKSILDKFDREKVTDYSIPIKDVYKLGKALLEIMDGSCSSSDDKMNHIYESNNESEEKKLFFSRRDVVITRGHLGVVWCVSQEYSADLFPHFDEIDKNSIDCQVSNDRVFLNNLAKIYTRSKSRQSVFTHTFRSYPAIPLNNNESISFNTNGAGDAFCSGLIHHITKQDNGKELGLSLESESGSNLDANLNIRPLKKFEITQCSIDFGLCQAYLKIISSSTSISDSDSASISTC